LAQKDDTDTSVRGFCQRAFQAGETVFDEGESGDKLYVIQSGEIELSRTAKGGQRVVARLGAGDFFGELGVVLGKPCINRAVAVCNTRVLELDRETLHAMCLSEPEIAIRMIRVLVSRLIEAERRLAVLGVDDLLRPMVRDLIRKAEPDPEGGYRIPSTLRELADDCGLSMFEAHRALHQLFDSKAIRLVDDCLHAKDLEALSACLEPERAPAQ
jgi:CRP/FNR family cyclic AMP-dependent transcriptional regulator